MQSLSIKHLLSIGELIWVSLSLTLSEAYDNESLVYLKVKELKVLIYSLIFIPMQLNYQKYQILSPNKTKLFITYIHARMAADTVKLR